MKLSLMFVFVAAVLLLGCTSTSSQTEKEQASANVKEAYTEVYGDEQEDELFNGLKPSTEEGNLTLSTVRLGRDFNIPQSETADGVVAFDLYLLNESKILLITKAGQNTDTTRGTSFSVHLYKTGRKNLLDTQITVDTDFGSEEVPMKISVLHPSEVGSGIEIVEGLVYDGNPFRVKVPALIFGDTVGVQPRFDFSNFEKFSEYYAANNGTKKTMVVSGLGRDFVKIEFNLK